ncbi:MAG: hypothetical protein LBD47_11590 [Treponema sp.]|jgi:hypothetical protein|nr:hypothetical protein [Treponema sp.]
MREHQLDVITANIMEMKIWRMMKKSGGDSAASPESTPDMEMWRTILLSGLAVYLKLSW